MRCGWPAQGELCCRQPTFDPIEPGHAEWTQREQWQLPFPRSAAPLKLALSLSSSKWIHAEPISAKQRLARRRKLRDAHWSRQPPSRPCATSRPPRVPAASKPVGSLAIRKPAAFRKGFRCLIRPRDRSQDHSHRPFGSVPCLRRLRLRVGPFRYAVLSAVAINVSRSGPQCVKSIVGSRA